MCLTYSTCVGVLKPPNPHPLNPLLYKHEGICYKCENPIIWLRFLYVYYRFVNLRNPEIFDALSSFCNKWCKNANQTNIWTILWLKLWTLIVDFRIIHFEKIFIPNLKRSLKVSSIRHKLKELGKYFIFRPGGYDPPSW